VNWWVILNPTAGGGRDPGGLRKATQAALDAVGVEYVIHVPRSSDEVAEVIADGARRGVSAFVAVGGDGTAHDVVNGIMGCTWQTRPVLGILPAGSGSDFIRTFGIPQDLGRAAAHLTGDGLYTCDVGIVEGSFGTRFFLNEVSLGITAATVKRSLRLPARLGKLRYTAGFWLMIGRFRPGPVEAQVDGRTITADGMAVVIANGQFFGGAMNVAPRASTGDGVFDVQVFSGPRRQAFTVMPRVARGTHLTLRAVQRRTGSVITIECPEDWPIEADGEVIGDGRIAVQVIPGAIDFKI
jgi:YegS/Rv2252/BmrU family lipid kinase